MSTTIRAIDVGTAEVISTVIGDPVATGSFGLLATVRADGSTEDGFTLELVFPSTDEENVGGLLSTLALIYDTIGSITVEGRSVAEVYAEELAEYDEG